MMGRVFHVKVSWAQEKTYEQFLTLFPKYLPCPWDIISPRFHSFQTSGWLRFHWPLYCREILPWHWICHLHLRWMFGHTFGWAKPAPKQEIPTLGQELFPKEGLDSFVILETSFFTEWKSWLAPGPKSCCDPDNAPTANSPCLCWFNLLMGFRGRYTPGVFLVA